jgi:exodeoxyribonuclease VII small subunit
MSKQSLESRMARLEEIVAAMESSGKPLEEVIALFKEGVELTRQCKTELSRLELEVQKVLAENDDGSLKTEEIDV